MPRAGWWVALVLLAGLMIAGTLDRIRVTRPVHQAELLETDSLRVRALRTGSGAPTIVLLHGFGEHLLTWRMVVDPLARSHRVVALDLPGFGGSDKPAVRYTHGFLREQVITFLTRWTDPPVILVGHSMGGQLAVAVALERPDLVERLVLIAPAGYRVGLAGIADGMTPSRAFAIGRWEAARAFMTPMHDADWLAEPEELRDYDPALDPRFAAAMEDLLLNFDFKAIGNRFGDVRQPTLVIWGRRDPVIPAAIGDTIVGMMPCSTGVVLEQALHRPQVERPDRIVTLLRQFLHTDPC